MIIYAVQSRFNFILVWRASSAFFLGVFLLLRGTHCSWWPWPCQPSSQGLISSITVVGGDDLYNLLLGVLMSCLRTFIFNGIALVDFLLESGFLVEDHVLFLITIILFSTLCSRCSAASQWFCTYRTIYNTYGWFCNCSVWFCNCSVNTEHVLYLAGSTADAEQICCLSLVACFMQQSLGILGLLC